MGFGRPAASNIEQWQVNVVQIQRRPMECV
jgi:hypothetical protein